MFGLYSNIFCVDCKFIHYKARISIELFFKRVHLSRPLKYLSIFNRNIIWTRKEELNLNYDGLDEKKVKNEIIIFEMML